MSVNYFCSGFDINHAFWKELSDRFKSEMKDTKSIVFIPGGVNKIEKVKTKYVPIFLEHFIGAGINFEEYHIITNETTNAKELIENASFVMLMGGDPFAQKELCEQLGIIDTLKNYNGVLLGMSAGAMLMSKYIIITPCSQEYPDFHIEPGLNLSNISIYPHNNFEGNEYPNKIDLGDEIYTKDDLLKVASQYGNFYLLQDHMTNENITNVSLIRTHNDEMEFITQNEGKIFVATPNGIELLKNKLL